ncbi:MAG: hypothetical protein HYX68_13840 [Planctomycetes bacterium]|nr:hypothetical protein [Planctomycetota bacterium]
MDEVWELRGDRNSKPIAYIFKAFNSPEHDLTSEERTEDEAEYAANACLIAAAPELLHLAELFQMTCEDRLSLLRDDEKEWRGDDEWRDMIGHFNALLTKCRKAIGQATGK